MVKKMFNKKDIMKRAWELKREDDRNLFSQCLKMAWAEARKPEKSEKEMLMDALLEKETEANSHNNGYAYEAVVSDWEKYGKSRTYFSIIETRKNSRHYKKISYGFFDNVTGTYMAEKYNDLKKNFTVSGARMK